MKLTFFILIANAFAKVKLFHENCTPCERFHTCTDIAAQVYRNLALHKEEEELIQVMEILFQLPNRYFCLRAASDVAFKFDLPPPTVSLETIPLLLALNGQPEIAIGLLSIIEIYDRDILVNTTSQLNTFIIHLELHDDETLHEFLSEYLLLAEIAYIERNAAVISILPSVLAAAAQDANMTEIQETMDTKGNEGRMMQMLLYAGLRNDDLIEDEEHAGDGTRFHTVASYIQKSNDELNEKMEQFDDPHSHPTYWSKARELDIEPVDRFHPALIYLLSSTTNEISLRELVFLLQASPELSADPLIPYLFAKDEQGHKKLRTYLLARFLTPEIFTFGPSMSAAWALLSNT